MRDIYQNCEEVLIWFGEPRVLEWDDGVHTLIDAKPTRPVSWTMDDQDFVILEDYWQDFSSSSGSCGLATSIYLDYNFQLFCMVKLLSSDRHFIEIPSLASLQDLPYPLPFENYRDRIATTLEALIDMSLVAQALGVSHGNQRSKY